MLWTLAWWAGWKRWKLGGKPTDSMEVVGASRPQETARVTTSSAICSLVASHAPVSPSQTKHEDRWRSQLLSVCAFRWKRGGAKEDIVEYIIVFKYSAWSNSYLQPPRNWTTNDTSTSIQVRKHTSIWSNDISTSLVFNHHPTEHILHPPRQVRKHTSYEAFHLTRWESTHRSTDASNSSRDKAHTNILPSENSKSQLPHPWTENVMVWCTQNLWKKTSLDNGLRIFFKWIPSKVVLN